jgi:hypothetical protein
LTSPSSSLDVPSKCMYLTTLSRTRDVHGRKLSRAPSRFSPAARRVKPLPESLCNIVIKMNISPRSRALLYDPRPGACRYQGWDATGCRHRRCTCGQPLDLILASVTVILPLLLSSAMTVVLIFSLPQSGTSDCSTSKGMAMLYRN